MRDPLEDAFLEHAYREQQRAEFTKAAAIINAKQEQDAAQHVTEGDDE